MLIKTIYCSDLIINAVSIRKEVNFQMVHRTGDN